MDNVSVKLFIKCLEAENGNCPPVYQNWFQENSVILDAPVNQTINISFDTGNFLTIGCTAIGNWSFRFNATDVQHGYKSWTPSYNFSVEKNDVTIIPFVGDDNPVVWRNGSDYTLLSVRVYDNDSENWVSSANATIWVNKNASVPDSWDIGKYLAVNTSGYINYNFLADGTPPIHECNYTVGAHNWKAGIGGVYEDVCYKETNSSNYQVQVWSELSPIVVTPVDTQGFIVGELINISGYVEDDCSYRMPHGVEDVTLDDPNHRFRIFPPSRSCYVSAEDDGYYNCSWDSSSKTPKNWNIEMKVDKSYYATNITTEYNAFNIGYRPVLSNPYVNPTIEGWGREFSFNVYFSDPDNNVDNISLWKSFDNSTWELVRMQQKVSAGDYVTFNERFTCSDSNRTPGRVNYFKFNVTDPFNYTDETTSLTFNLTEDDVTVMINYTETEYTVRRLSDDNATFQLRIRDDDYSAGNPNGSYYPTGLYARIWITSNGTNYTNYLPCTTTDGHCIVEYNPNCSTSPTVGAQYWKGYSNDTCYEYDNSTSVAFSVYGQLYVQIDTPQPSVILNRNTTVELNATVTDDCGNYLNDSTVTWYNESWDLLNSTYNTTWLVPYNYPLGSDVIHSNTTRGNYDPNTNSTNVMIYGWAEVAWMIPSNGTEYIAGQSKFITCHVRDANTLVELNDYNVSFYINDTYQESKLTNGTGEEGNVTFTFSTNRPAGWYNLTCRIGSNTVKYYNVTAENFTNEIRVSRPLIIDQIVTDPTIPDIYRNDSFDPHTVNVTVHVKDAELTGDGADGATVWFYDYNDAYIANCTTNSSGWC
ncbi:MAG: hypothetical protein KAS32_05390, partial [Candidatus Peribacteraceae bacterium]|nr:hypothetical protein [Candidatus Peribacteraceae bacterium]